MEKRTIPVVGMACSSCSANVEKKLKSLNGIHSASVSLPGRSALVEYDPQVISLEDMKQEISGIGYDMVIENDRSAIEIERQEYSRLKKKAILSWCFSVLCMCLSMKWIHIDSDAIANQLAMLVSIANFLFCGRMFYISAWKQLCHHTANMDSLVALSTSIAFLFSVFNTFYGASVWGGKGMEWHTYFDASIMIITFVLTGRVLEEKAKNGMSGSIRELMGLTPKTAHLVVDDNIDDVPISTIIYRRYS